MKRCVRLMRPGRLIPRNAPFLSPHLVTGGRHYKRLIARDPLSESERIKKPEQDSLEHEIMSRKSCSTFPL